MKRLNMKLINDRSKQELRRELRRNSTETERTIWQRVRRRQMGPEFRRQVSIGRYVVDFYCPSAQLIVEIDGGVHLVAEAQAYDGERDKFFMENGFRVLRFTNDEVEKDLNAVIKRVMAAVKG